MPGTQRSVTTLRKFSKTGIEQMTDQEMSIFTCTYTVRPWSDSSGRQLQTLRGHTGRVQSVAFSPDGQNFGPWWIRQHGVFMGCVKRATNQNASRPLRVCRQSIQFDVQSRYRRNTGCGFSPDGTVFASARSDSTVRLWRIASSEPLKTLKGHTNIVTALAFSPDNLTLVSGSEDSTIRVWRWQ